LDSDEHRIKPVHDAQLSSAAGNGKRGPERRRRALSSALITSPVTVEDHVWIGSGAMVLKGVTLGEGCVVAAAAVVTRSVPEGALVAGHPARVIREAVRWR
jgi:acetyltransferase-like isoleucine patch superfamily enzyme